MTLLFQEQLFARSHLQSIIDGVLAPQPRSFSLIGAKFMGKTHILSHLAAPNGPLHHHEGGEGAERHPLVVYYDCTWPKAQKNLVAFLGEGLWRRLRQQNLSALPRGEGGIAASEWLQRLVADLLQANYQPILLLDNFDFLITQAHDEVEHAFSELRSLTHELAFVVAGQRSLHEANRHLASSLLFNLLNQIFLRLIEPEESERILYAATANCLDQEQLVAQLAEWTGGHPFLLSRVSEILLDVNELLPGDQKVGYRHLPLIRMRMAEDYGRLLFGEFLATLQDQRDPQAGEALDLVRRLLMAPLPVAGIEPASARAFYWLLNKGMIRIANNDSCTLFSSLFADYISAQLVSHSEGRILAGKALNTREIIEAEAQQFTPQERNLMRYFLDRPGQVITIDQLLIDVWKRPNASARRVQEGIRRLRNRLDELQLPVGQIENEWGEGYRFVPLSSEPPR